MKREKRQPTRHALCLVLEEPTALDRGARSFADRLTNETETNKRGEC